MTLSAGNLYVDHSRADTERRMKILELAGGDLRRARELYAWVQTGDFIAAVLHRNDIPDFAELRK